jgi:hypothetical protein
MNNLFVGFKGKVRPEFENRMAEQLLGSTHLLPWNAGKKPPEPSNEIKGFDPNEFLKSK